MKLNQIINKIECKVIGSKMRNIEHLTHIAQDCKNNSMYFCLNGKTNNGENWIKTAINSGAKVVVCQQSVTLPKNITQIIVKDARKAMSQIASIFYGEPSKQLKIIGVTGTNGKTTTTHIISYLFKSKYNVGLIGTNGVFYNDQVYQTGFTTPDPILLHKILADMLKSGVQYVVMEYSAHAIYLQKLWGILSDIVAFTNLSQDHLDYFANMDSYFNAKRELFASSTYNHAVVCIDDKYGKQIAKVAKNVITCSTNQTDANIFIVHSTHTTTSQTFEVEIGNKKHVLSTSLLGKFNLQNILVGLSVCLKCGLTIEELAKQLQSLKGVDGRFECYSNDTNTVVIDYAHTPDGLENVLKTASELAAKNRVICVFGCGGSRDVEKRPIMGKVAQKFADFTVITTDNPRYEDNFEIAQEIAGGFTKNKFKIVLDRGQALREALDMCLEGDIVVLAGKGAENYTEINGTKVYSSDKELVKKVLNIL